VSASKPAVPEPTRIGKYEIVAKLGAGAFGTVYKAMDPELGRLVAIKTIRLEGLAASQASLDDLLARFKREAQVAAKVKHPNIVTIYEIGNAEGLSYISMEFVDGVGLDRVIAKSGRMSIERAAAIGAQVADALDYAWRQQKLVHRDIKPANIMIEPGDRVKVTDFGIAKATDSADHLTATGSLLGTPSYMSPEQARGGTIDGRSDLFSVGCIVYEMLAGQKAFRGETLTAIMFKIITEEPPALRTLDPTVTDEMLRIIAKALSKAPETRYQSGRELADDLLALTRPGFVPTLRAAETPTLPPTMPPGDVPTIATPPTARAAATLSSAATTVRPSTAPAAGGPPPLPPTVLTPPTRTEPPKAAPPARPTKPPVGQPARRSGGGVALVVGLGAAGLLALAVVVGGGWYLFGRKAATTAPSPSPAGAGAVETPAPTPAAVADTTASAEAAASPAPSGAAATDALPTSAPPSAGTASRPGPRAAENAAPPGPAARPPVPPPFSSSSAPGGPPPGDYSFLDDVPPETPDGRAAGEALAQKYGSGGSTSYSGTRFARRQRVPRGATPAERPAVATLLYLHSVEEAYHRKSGRYGTFRELAAAGLLRLDVRFDAERFQRARYAFNVTTSAEGYRVEAMPEGPVGRALLVDDTGFVRWQDE
jgi:serine/threonine protein kinase